MKVASGQLGPVNLGIPQVITTIPLPLSGDDEYRLLLRFTGLDSDHEIVVIESKTGIDVYNDVQANGFTSNSFYVQVDLGADDDEVEVTVYDQSSLSAAATVEWDLFKEDVAEGGGGSSGLGNIVVTHNTGGANNMKVTTAGGAGIDQVEVSAYLKSEWDTNPLTAERRGRVFTKNTGEWEQVMMLDAGTYTFIFAKDGFNLATKEQAVA